MPGRASATISGPCTATLAGLPVTAGHDSASSAVRVDYRSVVHYDGETTNRAKVKNIAVHVEVQSFNVRTTEGKTDGNTWTATADVKKYAWVGVGLYHVRGVALGSGGTVCTGLAYVCVADKTPFLTVAGILAGALGVVALYLLIKGLVVRSSRRRGELATRFGLTGLVGGIAAVVLLQQFCVLPLTETLSGGIVGGGLLGMALIGALVAGGHPKQAPGPVVVPPKRREELEQVYRFEPSEAACNACKSHAAHRTYRSEEAAAGDRAHPGCDCKIAARPSHRGELVAHFPGARSVYDDRET